VVKELHGVDVLLVGEVDDIVEAVVLHHFQPRVHPVRPVSTDAEALSLSQEPKVGPIQHEVHHHRHLL
jgi:hypothetical protein